MQISMFERNITSKVQGWTTSFFSSSFIISISDHSKYCTMHKVTPSQPSTCHKIQNHLRATNWQWNASQFIFSRRKALQNIPKEKDKLHRSPPPSCTSNVPWCPALIAACCRQMAAQVWLVSAAVQGQTHRWRGEHHRLFWSQPGRS